MNSKIVVSLKTLLITAIINALFLNKKGMKKFRTIPFLVYVVCPVLFIVVFNAQTIYAGNNEPWIQHQDLFVHSGTAYPRLPALLVTTEGTVIAATQWRKNSKADFGNPTDILIRRSTDAGATWSDNQTVFDGGSDYAGALGVVIQDKTTDRIFIIFGTIPVVGYGSESEFAYNSALAWRPFLLVFSDDDGVTWSEPTEVAVVADSDGSYAAPGNSAHGIQLDSGRLIVPAWAQPKKSGGFESSRAGLIYSDDHGTTWKVGAIGPEGSNESTVAVTVNGQVYLNWRHRGSEGGRGWSRSTDNGLTFTQSGYHDELINPSVHAGVVRYSTTEDSGQNILLFSNPVGPERTNMNVRISYDEALKWSNGSIIYSGAAAYSDMAAAHDKTILCLYEADSYTKIRLARFNLSWLTGSTSDSSAIYKGNALPSQSDPAWTFSGSDGATESNVASVSGGILTIDRTTSGHAYWTKRLIFDRTSKGATAEIRSRVLSSSTVPIELTVETGDRHLYAVNIFKDKLTYWSGAEDIVIADGLDNFTDMHTYRLVILPGIDRSERNVEIYRDSILISTQPATNVLHLQGEMIKWGKGWTREGVTAEVDYVSYDVSGAYRPDIDISNIKYNTGAKKPSSFTILVNQFNIQVNLSDNGPYTLSLFSLSGRTVAKKTITGSGNSIVPITGFSPGIYIAQIKGPHVTGQKLLGIE